MSIPSSFGPPPSYATPNAIDQSGREVPKDPMDQLASEYGLHDIHGMKERILSKIAGLRSENDRELASKFVRGQAFQILYHLNNLKQLGALPNELMTEGRNLLRGLEDSSNLMIRHYNSFMEGSREQEQRFNDFEAKVSEPSDFSNWDPLPDEPAEDSSAESSFI